MEIGIQTFDEEVSARIERRQDEARVVENLRFLADHTGVHVHADLIVGLPGEDRAQFGAGFDRLLGLGPQEIQVGILKRLRGTPIVRHDASHEMVYRADPPYDVLHTRDLSEDDVVAMNRFAKYWDRIANSGNFIETAPLIWEGRASAFWAFSECTEALYQALGRTHSFGLHELSRHLFSYLVETCDLGPKRVAACMVRDLHRTPGRKTPGFLRPHLEERPKSRRTEKATGGLQRQQRHSASS